MTKLAFIANVLFACKYLVIKPSVVSPRTQKTVPGLVDVTVGDKSSASG